MAWPNTTFKGFLCLKTKKKYKNKQIVKMKSRMLSPVYVSKQSYTILFLSIWWSRGLMRIFWNGLLFSLASKNKVIPAWRLGEIWTDTECGEHRLAPLLIEPRSVRLFKLSSEVIKGQCSLENGLFVPEYRFLFVSVSKMCFQSLWKWMGSVWRSLSRKGVEFPVECPVCGSHGQTTQLGVFTSNR